mgnify:CR=1 FL=1
MKACIFDLDGTLTDTLDSLEYSVNETMKQIHMPQITKEQCRDFVGNGAKVLIEKALKAGGDEALDRLDEAMEVYGRVFDENCTYKVVPYKGIERMLETLKKQGIRLVIKEIFGEGLFDWIQGQKEGVPRKPDPSAALDIADRLGAEIAETAYIGDSEVDLATGKAAGMKTILVSWGFRGRKALEEDGADCIVDSVDEILEIMR